MDIDFVFLILLVSLAALGLITFHTIMRELEMAGPRRSSSIDNLPGEPELSATLLLAQPFGLTCT